MKKKTEKLKETFTSRKCILCEEKCFSLVMKVRGEDSGKEFRLVKCINCGLAHILPIPRNLEELYSDEEYYAYNDLEKFETGTIYDRILGHIGRYSISRTFDGKRHGIKNVITELLFKTVSHRFNGHHRLVFTEREGEASKVLDIGAGGGTFLDVLRSLGWETYGVDISAIAVRKLNERGFTVFHGELEEANYPDNSFDVVRASFVMEHVKDPLLFLKEIYRILKPGGKTIISVPNIGSIHPFIFKEYWTLLSVPQHIYHFDSLCLEKIINMAGLKLIFKRMYTAGSFYPSIQNKINGKGPNHFFTFVGLAVERFTVSNPFFCDAIEVYAEKE